MQNRKSIFPKTEKITKKQNYLKNGKIIKQFSNKIHELFLLAFFIQKLNSKNNINTKNSGKYAQKVSSEHKNSFKSIITNISGAVEWHRVEARLTGG